MQLNDLLKSVSVDPERTLVLRHSPQEPAFRRALPLLAGERLDLFEAYQSYQGEKVERSISARMGGWIAAFIGYGAGKAVFVGVYEIASSRSVTREEFWSLPAILALRDLGTPGWRAKDAREMRLLFNLPRLPIHENLRGKLVVNWPPMERT